MITFLHFLITLNYSCNVVVGTVATSPCPPTLCRTCFMVPFPYVMLLSDKQTDEPYWQITLQSVSMHHWRAIMNISPKSV